MAARRAPGPLRRSILGVLGAAMSKVPGVVTEALKHDWQQSRSVLSPEGMCLSLQLCWSMRTVPWQPYQKPSARVHQHQSFLSLETVVPHGLLSAAHKGSSKHSLSNSNQPFKLKCLRSFAHVYLYADSSVRCGTGFLILDHIFLAMSFPWSILGVRLAACSLQEVD